MATQIVFDTELVASAAEPCSRIFAPAPLGPLVLGLDGSDTGRGAAAMALSLARKWGVPLHVVTVIEPERDTWDNGVEWRRDAAREHERRAALARFTDAAAESGITCETEIDRGNAVTHLIGCATSRSAALILLGLHHSSEPTPVFVDETALRVLRRSRVPVLAVTSAVTELPRTAVAAIDFTPASRQVARAALGVLRPGGTLLLAHVQPGFSTSATRAEGVQLSYENGVMACFERLVRELALPPFMRVEIVVLQGAPLDELSALAERVEADLIAVGTGRSSEGVARLATGLLRQRRHTILAVPAPARTIQRFLDDA